MSAPVPPEALPAQASADDEEPPLGDYDYVEVDNGALDYDFELPDGEDNAPIAEADPAADIPPATGLAAQWLEVHAQLGLGGMTANIAANCTLVQAEGDRWLLHLDPAQSALFNATQQRRLNDALNQQQGRTIALEIVLCKPEQETPALAAARRRIARQHAAEVSIAEDPLVQQMIQQFSASVREGSIEPLATSS